MKKQNELISVIEKLDHDRELITSLDKNGNVAYDNYFSWDVMRERIKDMCENL